MKLTTASNPLLSLYGAWQSCSATVAQDFPDLLPAVESGLSVSTSLMLQHHHNPVALTFVGRPSSGKSTVVEMFTPSELTYLTDKFTPASFVSQAATRTTQQLDKVDLLPKVRHKVLLTPELAPMFRGEADELTGRFTLLTRVLDGFGLTTDAGVHGQRGYRGDYQFNWLGATTPLSPTVWKVMGSLGSRMFFYDMSAGRPVGVEDLLAQIRSETYAIKLDRCRSAVGRVLKEMAALGVHAVPWPAEPDDRVERTIAKLALLVSGARDEDARRAFTILHTLGKAHALLHGRLHLESADVVPVQHVALSSLPSRAGLALRACILLGSPEVSLPALRDHLDLSHRTAEHCLRRARGLDLGTVKESLGSKPTMFTLAPRLHWLLRAPEGDTI